jgi:hypothetical protein
MTPWVEKRRQLASQRVASGDAGALVAIAEEANVTHTKLTGIDPYCHIR